MRTLGAGIRVAREDEAAGLDRLGALAPVAARFGIGPSEIAELHRHLKADGLDGARPAARR